MQKILLPMVWRTLALSKEHLDRIAALFAEYSDEEIFSMIYDGYPGQPTDSSMLQVVQDLRNHIENILQNRRDSQRDFIKNSLNYAAERLAERNEQPLEEQLADAGWDVEDLITELEDRLEEALRLGRDPMDDELWKFIDDFLRNL